MINCYLTKQRPPCFVHLGRHGDVMIILPAMLRIFQTTGIKPVMMVCQEFAGTLDGCSYVTPWPMEGFSWFRDVDTAKKIAEYWFDEVIIPKWWDCPGHHPPPPRHDEVPVVLNHQGRRMVVSAEEWESYQVSQWKAAGFTRQQLIEWPLVFDRRDSGRESVLASRVAHWKKPVVLYNFSGVSNPMGFEPEVLGSIRHLNGAVDLVDLRHVHAERIYDLLGLYDRALCLITGDTATLHLAAASNIPCIALLANGGAGSIARGNVKLKLRYHEVSARVGEIKSVVESLLVLPSPRKSIG
jgi:hypothetical protein